MDRERSAADRKEIAALVAQRVFQENRVVVQKSVLNFPHSQRLKTGQTGDARITMQEEASRGDLQNFDLLIVDAFRGDAIPVHLLTREAMRLYLQHMRGARSVIAFHISNSSLDLRPVMAALASDYHLADIEVSQEGASDWVLLSPDPEMLRINGLATSGQRVEVNRSIKEWTDDYSNLLELLNRFP